MPCNGGALGQSVKCGLLPLVRGLVRDAGRELGGCRGARNAARAWPQAPNTADDEALLTVKRETTAGWNIGPAVFHGMLLMNWCGRLVFCSLNRTLYMCVRIVDFARKTMGDLGRLGVQQVMGA
jgi:hypothetical protein